jgi:hypothetical protein
MADPTVAIREPVNSAMQPGWTFVLFSGICLIFTPLLLVLVRSGPKWKDSRTASQAKQAAKEQAKLGANEERKSL